MWYVLTFCVGGLFGLGISALMKSSGYQNGYQDGYNQGVEDYKNKHKHSNI